LQSHGGIKTSVKGRGDPGDDVSSPRSRTPVRSLSAQGSYAATFESDSHIDSADVDIGIFSTVAFVNRAVGLNRTLDY